MHFNHFVSLIIAYIRQEYSKVIISRSQQIDCNSSNPQYISWKFNGGTLPNNVLVESNELKFTSINIQNRGVYECTESIEQRNVIKTVFGVFLKCKLI